MISKINLSEKNANHLTACLSLIESFIAVDSSKPFLENKHRDVLVRGLRAFRWVCANYIKTFGSASDSASLKDTEGVDLKYKSDFYAAYKDYFLQQGMSMPRINAVREIDPEKIDRSRHIEEDTKELFRYYLIKLKFTVDIRQEGNELGFWAKLDQAAQRKALGGVLIKESGSAQTGHWYKLDLYSPLLFDTRPKASKQSKNQVTQPYELQQPKRLKEISIYVAYYWRHAGQSDKQHEKVGCAEVVVTHLQNADSVEWLDVSFTLYYTDQLQNKQFKTLTLLPNQPIEVSNGILYLRLEDKETTFDGRPKVYTQLTVNVARADRREWLLGTYSTAHRDPGEPTAGLMVWQKMNSTEACREVINKTLTSPESVNLAVFQYLAGRRVDVKRDDFKDLTDLPSMRSVSNLVNFSRTYQGYYYNPEKDRMVLFSCRVDPVGRVEFHSDQQTHNVHAMFGYAQMVREAIRINFDYLREHDTYRLQYNMEKGLTKRGNQQYWRGQYAGFDSLLIKPVSGNVLLRIPENGEQIQLVDMSKLLFSQQPLGRDVLELLQESITEYPSIYVKAPPKIETDGVGDSFGFQGEYTCLVSWAGDAHSANPKVIPYHLSIHTDRGAVLQRKGVFCQGKAFIDNDKFLHITFLPDENDFSGTLIFSIQQPFSYIGKGDEVKHLYGVLLQVKYNQQLEASAALLMPDALPQDVDEWSESFDCFSQEFNQFDAQFQGGLTFMSGRINRTLRVPMTANRPPRPRNKDYRRVPFLAACYLAQLYKRNVASLLNTQKIAEKALIRSHLREAFQMGLGASQFAGSPVSAWLENQTEQLATLSEPDREKLENDLLLLREDTQLLQEAIGTDGPFDHPDLKGLITNIWKN